jgi:cell division protein ZapA
MSDGKDEAQGAVAAGQAQAVSVDIYDQTYHLRGQDVAYIQQLAELVDSKMRAVASQGKTVDSLRVAVLAALNIADELVTLERKYQSLTGSFTKEQSTIRNRASSLSGLLDSVLAGERRAG